MSQAGIDFIQSWLSSELEQRGIDAVIYTRHVLDLFLSSRHTTDLHLAEKEKNIFASLPPGYNKRKPKHKYNRRSHSFTYFDETALKKEMAVNCLLSASDNRDDSINTLIDELHAKLHNLRFLSDVGSSFDDGLIGKQIQKRHEDYHDAFPLLHPDNGYGYNFGSAHSIWSGNKKSGTQKMSTDNKEILKKKSTDDQPLNNYLTITSPLSSVWNKKGKSNLQSNNLSDYNANNQVARSRNTNTSSEKRQQFSPSGAVPFAPLHSKRKNRHIRRQQVGILHGIGKENLNKPTAQSRGQKNERNKRKLKPLQKPGDKSRNFLNNAGITLGTNLNGKSENSFSLTSSNNWKRKKSFKNVDEKEILHLYSAEIHEFFNEDSKQESPKSKWFRDPKSGCLEFEPVFKSKNETFTLEESFDGKDMLESWLWCPSPSLWETESGLSPGVAVSRLETIYRHPTNSEVDVDGEMSQEDQNVFSGVSNVLSVISDESSDSLPFEEPTFPLNTGVHQENYDLNLNCIKYPHHFEAPSTDDCVWSCNQLPDGNNNKSYRLKNDECHALILPDDILNKNTSVLDPVAHGDILNDQAVAKPLLGSRKDIWLQNAKDVSIEAELDHILSAGSMSPLTQTATTQKKLGFHDNLHFGKSYKSNAMDDFLSELSWKILDSTSLHWMINLDIPNQFCSGHDLLPFESFMKSQGNDAVSEEQNDDDGCYAAALVQSVVDVIRFADDQCFEEDTLNDLLKFDQLKASSDETPTTENKDFENSFLSPAPLEQDKQQLKQNALNTFALADCVTENQAWKTSLRIGNVWQAISGIRPVDIVYSEKHQEGDLSVLQPSSLTHFRPIHPNEQDSDTNLSSSFQAEHAFESAEESYPAPAGYHDCATSESQVEEKGATACDMLGLELEIGKLLCESSTPGEADCKTFQPKFRKIGEDKSMQTFFEEQILMNDTDMCKSLFVRPPKANSR